MGLTHGRPLSQSKAEHSLPRLLAQPEFRCYLPDRGRADQHRIVRILNSAADACRKPGIIKKATTGKCACPAAGSFFPCQQLLFRQRLKKASVTAPLAMPGVLFLSACGTSRAQGWPDFTMMISSPARTKASSLDRCVFASCTFTVFMLLPSVV
jgi:hypothetical protein